MATFAPSRFASCGSGLLIVSSWTLYCAALKLVIEIDGDTHATEDGRRYDQERTRVLEGYGLRVVRFSNDDVLHHFEAVCQQIASMFPAEE